LDPACYTKQIQIVGNHNGFHWDLLKQASGHIYFGVLTSWNSEKRKQREDPTGISLLRSAGS